MANISQLSFYYDKLRARIDTSTQPEIEDIGSSATDSLGQTVADGGLIPDALDGSIKSRTTLVTAGQTDEPFIAIDAGERIEADFYAIAGLNMRDSFPATVEQQLDAYHHTADLTSNPQGTATLLAHSAYMQGILGQARAYLDGDGVDDLVTLTGMGSELSIAAGTIELDFLMKDLDGTQFLFAQKGAGESRMYIWMNTSDLIATWGTNSGKTMATLAANTRYHFVATWDDPNADGDGNLTGYLDGVEVFAAASYVSLDAFAANPQLLEISGANNANAKIYSSTYWNRALSASEVLARFNGGEIAAADQWGNPAELMPNTVDRDFSGASAWTNVNLTSYDETGDLSIIGAFIGQYCTCPVASAPMTAAFRYRLQVDAIRRIFCYCTNHNEGEVVKVAYVAASQRYNPITARQSSI